MTNMRQTEGTEIGPPTHKQGANLAGGGGRALNIIYTSVPCSMERERDR